MPTKLPDYIDIDELIRLMEGDKKSVSGKINLILARRIGRVEIFKDVDKNTIKKSPHFDEEGIKNTINIQKE